MRAVRASPPTPAAERVATTPATSPPATTRTSRSADLDGDGGDDIVVPHDNAYASFHEGTGVAFDAELDLPPDQDAGRALPARSTLGRSRGTPTTKTPRCRRTSRTRRRRIADLDGDGALERSWLLERAERGADRSREGVAVWACATDDEHASRGLGDAVPRARLSSPGSGLIEGEQRRRRDQPGHGRRYRSRPPPAPSCCLRRLRRQDPRRHRRQATRSGRRDLHDRSERAHGRRRGRRPLRRRPPRDRLHHVLDRRAARAPLFILDAGGNQLHQVPLPGRGAMPVPTLADVDGDGRW